VKRRTAAVGRCLLAKDDDKWAAWPALAMAPHWGRMDHVSAGDRGGLAFYLGLPRGPRGVEDGVAAAGLACGWPEWRARR